MTLVAISPEKYALGDSNWAGAGTWVIDAAGEKCATVFHVPKSGTIDRVSFRVASVGTSQTLRAGLETLDASGDPSGTQYGGSAVGTQASPAGGNTYEVTLGTPATATLQDRVALVLQFNATVGNVTFAGVQRGIGTAGSGFPYSDNFTGTWAKTNNALLNCAIRYNDGTYANIGHVPGVTTQPLFNTGTTPDEVGNLWTPPFACAVGGIWAVFDLDVNADCILYDTDGTAVLGSATMLAVERGAVGLSMFEGLFADQTLTVGQAYRLILRPGAASPNLLATRCTVPSAAYLGSLPGGTVLYETSRTNVGAWTDTNTQRILCGPILTKLDDGTGGGGGAIYHGAMNGGML